MADPLFNTGLRTNANGSIRPFTTAEILAIGLKTAGVKDGSHPTRSLDPGSASIHRDWFCNGTAVKDAIAAILGGVRTTVEANPRLSRLMPMIVPGETNYPAMAIETITGAGGCGKDDDQTVPQYPKLRLRVRHELAFFGLQSDDSVISEQLRYTEVLPSQTEVRYLSLGGMSSSLKYITADAGSPLYGRPIPVSIGRPDQTVKFAFKWWRIPLSAWNNAAPPLFGGVYQRVRGPATFLAPEGSYVGCINKFPFFGRPAGTVLFDGVDEEIVPDLVDGTYCFNIISRFTERVHGWNKIWYQARPGEAVDSGYYYVSRTPIYHDAGDVPDGVSLYNERDLNRLWIVGN
jgi:hypothetical protein